MGITYASESEVEGVIEGAVIERFELIDGGARVFLRDGRTVVIPGGEGFYICFTRDILQ
jgi:hypothetical protein